MWSCLPGIRDQFGFIVLSACPDPWQTLSAWTCGRLIHFQTHNISRQCYRYAGAANKSCTRLGEISSCSCLSPLPCLTRCAYPICGTCSAPPVVGVVTRIMARQSSRSTNKSRLERRDMVALAAVNIPTSYIVQPLRRFAPSNDKL